jgi:hypothetical protein
MGGSVLGRGIIKGCLDVDGFASEVVRVDSGVRCLDEHAFAKEFLLR